MVRIQYPEANFRIKQEDNKEWIFDDIRKLWVRLTPEEWVRQNFLQYLIHTMRYPASLIAVEKEIRVGELRKRCDIVVYQSQEPWMIVECKEMNVTLEESTAMQVLRYNMALRASYLAVTNGAYTYAFDITTQQAMEVLPKWNNIN